MQSFGELSVNKEMLFGRHAGNVNCFDMLTAAGSGLAAAAAAQQQQQQHQQQQQQHSAAASLNASDYTFFPNALAAAFLCPAPPSAFGLNQRCTGKIDSDHPSPLFFQATGMYYILSSRKILVNRPLSV